MIKEDDAKCELVLSEEIKGKCVLCLENDLVHKTACGHTYHEKCLKEQIKHLGKGTCIKCDESLYKYQLIKKIDK